MAKKTTKKELTTKKETLPAHIKKGSNRGSENVQMEDLIIPRIEIIQGLSPELKKKKELKYIPGAEQGMMFNTVTRELYPEKVLFVPVIFKKEYLVWRDRDDGGGFFGNFDTFAAADEEAAALSANDKKTYAAVDTAQHFVLVIKPSGDLEAAVISMNRTKMKVSRNFNTLIRLNGNDRFSRVYELSIVEETNDKGDYFNYAIKTEKFTPEKIYLQAEKLYEDLKSGAIKAKVDADYDEGEDEAKGEPAETAF